MRDVGGLERMGLLVAVDKCPKVSGGLNLVQYYLELGLLQVDNLVNVIRIAPVILNLFLPQI